MSSRIPLRTISVSALARVEGEGAMTVRVKDGKVDGVELRLYEPPRFFEGLLRGRSFTEPPDITARICGICPVAYQMTACRAIEDAAGVRVGGPLHELRRLLYCGEWIQSHALHIYLLHAPDFLGYAGAVEMAADHREAVERGLALKKVGNEIMKLLGGRPVHPVNVRVGGFYRVPAKATLRGLAPVLEAGLAAALETVSWAAGFDFPELDIESPLVALHDPDGYAIIDGRIVSSDGINASQAQFLEVFEEYQVQHSTALQSRIVGAGHYLCGPIARYSLNYAQLTPVAREAASAAGLGTSCRSLFRSIIVRAVEVVEACSQALGIIEGYEEPPMPAVPVDAAGLTGHACTEAPRGLLYHRYRIGDDGLIASAQITPPTSQNQAQIEHDLAAFVGRNLDLGVPELTLRCEQLIRSYDPCISCATHFLSLQVVGR
ncbi:MAG TPA: Ni/Fe hydrogenase subunit alpha [Actinomycetota bacterium]|nr:Ni/Fe hydrogenase subunit alpha [Actinomycetota bacterium]